MSTKLKQGLIALMVMLNFAAVAETVEYKFFPKQKSSYGSLTKELDDKYMFWKRRTFNIVDKKTMALESEVEIEIGKKKMKRNPEYVIQRNGKVYLFSTKVDKKLRKNSLFVQSFDANSGRYNNDLKKVDEFSYAGYKRWNSGSYNFVSSEDKTKFLVYTNLPYIAGEKEKFLFKVYDQDMSLLYENKVTLPMKDKDFGLDIVALRNNGEIIMSGERLKTIGKKVETDHHMILSFEDEAETIEEYEIKNEFGYLRSYALRLDGVGNLVIAGSYVKENQSGTDGVFHMLIDLESKEVLSETHKEFSDDFIRQDFSERQKKKADKRELKKGKETNIYNLRYKDLIINEDGTSTMVMEQYKHYTTTTTTYVNGKAQTRTVHHYVWGDIVVVNIDNQGQYAWMKKLDRYQHYTDGGYKYGGHTQVVGTENLYFFYNSGRNFMYQKIDSEGQVSSKILYNYKEEKKNMITSQNKVLDNGSILLMANPKGKGVQYGILTVADARPVQ